MSSVVLWALLNGLITGGVWAGIVLLRRQQRLSRQQMDLLEDVRRYLDERETLEQRLAELEERVDFTERLLLEERQTKQLPPAES